jgi:glycosyltransferase involved in cell wall biosynthesis
MKDLIADNKSIAIAVAVPVFNNERTVANVVRGVMALDLPVLVIDDGSTDGSSHALAGLPVSHIDFPVNRGKGTAIRAALQWAEENNFSHLITIDADGQHDPQDIPRFIEKIRDFPSRIIVGKRHFSTDVPGKSRFGRAWSNLWTRIVSGKATPDSQSGFRAYPAGLLAGMSFLGRRYEFEVEVLARAAWAGLEFDSVDVSVRYFQGPERVSHFKPLRDNFRISIIYALLVFRRLLPIPHRKIHGNGPGDPATGRQPREEPRGKKKIKATATRPGTRYSAGQSHFSACGSLT